MGGLADALGLSARLAADRSTACPPDGVLAKDTRHIARETATLRRLREKRNSRLRGTSSALEVAIE
jgi:hypothetical protein